MATIFDAIYAHIKTVSGLNSLIGGSTNPRAYYGRLPQTPTLPAVSYFEVDNTRLYRHRGPSGDAAPLIQFDCWATTQDSARAVSEQVRLAMNSFSGSIGGVTVDHATCVGSRDVPDEVSEGHHIAMDFEIKHREAVA